MGEVIYHNFKTKDVLQGRKLMISEIRECAKKQAINILPNGTSFRIIDRSGKEVFKMVIKE